MNRHAPAASKRVMHTVVTSLAVFWLVAAAAPLAVEPEASARVEPLAEPQVVIAGGPSEPQAPGAAPVAPKASEEVEDCLETTVDRIQSRYENVRDLQARFTQTSRPAHLANTTVQPTVSTGRMVVAKPGKMRWTYESPEKSLVVSDGQSLWLYDPAFGEAQRLPAGDGFLTGAATRFLLGEGEMRRDFEIVLESCEATRVALKLTPKQPAAYAQLVIVADPRSGDLSESRVDDLIGNATTIVFEDLLANQDPDEASFRFVAPEGVEVIELEAP